MGVRLFLSKRPEYPATRPVAVVVALRRHHAHRLWVTTPFRVAPRDWSESNERLKPSAAGAVDVNAALAALRAYAESALVGGASDDELRTLLKGRMGTAAPVHSTRLLDLFDAFLVEKAGTTRRRTVQVYESLRTHLKAFAPEATVDDVDRGFLDDFGRYLQGAGLANSTVNKITIRAKSFLAYLVARGTLAEKPESRALPTARNAALYLRAEELAALIALDLSGDQPGYRAVRDLFVAEAVTGQRYGDLQAMTWAQVDLVRGYWALPVEKTNVTLRVPLPAPVVRIIKARTGEATPLPRLSNQKANVYLKEVCRMAGIDTPVTTQALRAGVRETVTRPKWEVMTTHAARKTFVTLALQNGVPMNELLGYTHDDLRTLQQYAGQSDEGRQVHFDRIFGAL